MKQCLVYNAFVNILLLKSEMCEDPSQIGIVKDRFVSLQNKALYLFRSSYISLVHPPMLTRLVRCLFRGYVPIKCRPVKPKCVELQYMANMC